MQPLKKPMYAEDKLCYSLKEMKGMKGKMGDERTAVLLVYAVIFIGFIFILGISGAVTDYWPTWQKKWREYRANRHRTRCSGLRGADHHVSDSCHGGTKKAVGQANRKVAEVNPDDNFERFLNLYAQCDAREKEIIINMANAEIEKRKSAL